MINFFSSSSCSGTLLMGVVWFVIIMAGIYLFQHFFNDRNKRNS